MQHQQVQQHQYIQNVNVQQQQIQQQHSRSSMAAACSGLCKMQHGCMQLYLMIKDALVLVCVFEILVTHVIKALTTHYDITQMTRFE